MLDQEFSTIFPSKNTDFDNTHERQYLCGSLESSGEVLIQPWSKKNKKRKSKIGCIDEGKETVSLHLPSPRAAQLSARRVPSVCSFSPSRKGEHIRECPAPQLDTASVGHCQRGTLLSHHIQNTEVSCTTEGGGFGGRLGAQQAGLGMHQRERILLTTLQTPLEGPPTNLQRGLACRWFQLAHRHPSVLHTSPTQTPCLVASVCAPEGGKGGTGRELRSTHGKLAQLHKIVREQTNVDVHYHPGKGKAEAVSTRSSFEELKEGIQS